jgi:hypothetical protein
VASPQQSRDTRLRQGGESAEADISAMQATALVSLSSDVACGSYLRSTTARFSLCESKPHGDCQTRRRLAWFIALAGMWVSYSLPYDAGCSCMRRKAYLMMMIAF